MIRIYYRARILVILLTIELKQVLQILIMIVRMRESILVNIAAKYGVSK